MSDDTKKIILAKGIHDIIKTRGLTQMQAAKIMGITQPKLSKLLNGKFETISEMKLLDCLTRLGSNIRITISCPENRAGRTSIEFERLS